MKHLTKTNELFIDQGLLKDKSMRMYACIYLSVLFLSKRIPFTTKGDIDEEKLITMWTTAQKEGFLSKNYVLDSTKALSYYNSNFIKVDYPTHLCVLKISWNDLPSNSSVKNHYFIGNRHNTRNGITEWQVIFNTSRWLYEKDFTIESLTFLDKRR